MTKRTGSICSLIVVILLASAAMLLARNLQYSASKLLPMIIGAIVLFLSVVALVLEIRSGLAQDDAAEKADPEAEEEAAHQKKVYLGMAGWIFGFAIAIYVFGYMVSTPFFVGGYMKRHGSGWAGAIATAAIFTVVFYLVFNVALQADMYRGRLFLWLL